MLDMLMFAVIFTVVQVIGGFITMSLMMSKPFMKMFTKKYVSLAKDLMAEIEDEL